MALIWQQKKTTTLERVLDLVLDDSKFNCINEGFNYGTHSPYVPVKVVITEKISILIKTFLICVVACISNIKFSNY